MMLLSSEFRKKLLDEIAARNEVGLRTDHIFLTIERVMPTARDRGNFIVKASHLPDQFEVRIDDQDLFPHYYFQSIAMFDEMEEWLTVRGQTKLEILVVTQREE